MSSIDRPDRSEYAPYFERYISLVPPGDILMMLREQQDLHLRELEALSDAQANYRYAPGKWSVKEVVGHLFDCERIFTYRAMSFARGETQALPPYDDVGYVTGGRFGALSLQSLLGEFRAVRGATLALFSNLDSSALARRGIADNREYTVRAIAYIVAGHELHHWRLFRDRYLPGIQGK
jgi:uncharacterized damage-inducible protein DinB